MSRDALVVGINTYSYKRLNNLTAPAQDAEKIAQMLEKYGDFKVRRLPAVIDKQNNTIRVGKKTQVTLTQLKQAIVQLFKPKGKPPDTALLYFSGHGLRDELGISEGFLATSDVNQDIGNWGIRLKWLRELLQESEVRQQIIILDCCYAGEVLNVAEADPGDRGKGRDRCFIAASRYFEVAYEEIGNNHSVLTAALIKGLEPKQQRWVTNYTLVDLLNQDQNTFPQRPIFSNSGEPINLTRRWTTPVNESATLAQAICPYKGLNYFDCTEEDAKYFYGRTTLTDELLEKVRVGNFLAVLGASGSGKSSVVRAGLLYQLQMGRRLSGSENWHIKIFQPGEHPLHSLALAFLEPELSDIERASQLAQAEELVKKGSEGLRQLIAPADTQRVVLVVDQFEEAFTLCKDTPERQQFFECLLDTLPKTGDKFCLVLTMRADFFGKCTEQEYSGLAQQIQQNLVTVTPMSPDQLKQVIVEPAKRLEVEVEPELVKQMLTDVANAPGSLPLLQYTMMEMWKQSNDNCLRLNTYAKLGGVMGTLSQRATAVYESFSEEHKATTQHIFLALTQLGEGTEDTRRRSLKQDLVNEHYSQEQINSVVQELANKKLVVTSELVAKGGTFERVAVVDVAHEALIRHWELLRRWINENRDQLRQKRKIEVAAEEWRNKGKSKDDLAQGKLLKDANDWKKQQTGSLTLSNLALDFIQASIRQRWKNRLKFIGFGLIIPLGLTVYLGFAVEKQAKIRELWHRYKTSYEKITNNNSKEEEILAARIQLSQTLQELVKAGIHLNNLDFSSVKLGGINLSGANLSGANLSGANLNGANLSGANLQGANLSGVLMQGANLSGANLSGANLQGADLSGVRMQGANLSGVRMQSANLNGANLSSANLRSANLSGAKLSIVILTNADLNGANLTDADLSGTNLRGSTLKSATLRGSKLNLNGAIFWNTDLSRTNLSNADLKRTFLCQTTMSDGNFLNRDCSSITVGLPSASTDINIQKIETPYPNSSKKKVVLKNLAQALKLKEQNHGYLSNEIRFQITIDYYNMQQANEQVQIAQLSIKNAEASLKDVRALEEAGVGTRFDALSSQMNLISAQQEFKNVLLQQLIFHGQLASRLGLYTSTEVVVDDPVKKAGLWHLTLKESITLALKNIDKKQQQRRNQIKLEIEEAFAKVKYNFENIEASNQALNLANEKLRLARLRYQAGVGTNSDVIQSERILAIYSLNHNHTSPPITPFHSSIQH